MTATQVFKWFCKEQKITGTIINMINTINPRKVVKNEWVHMSFHEYYENIVRMYGFGYSLEKIMDDYCDALLRKQATSYDRYYQEKNIFYEKNRKIINKWRYFSDNNIIMNPDILKVGDTISFDKTWKKGEIVIDKIRLAYYEVVGTVKDDNINSHMPIGYLSNNCNSHMPIGYLRDNQGNKIVPSYIIKRKRKTYYGVS